jgi:hypothetical protein
MADPELLLMRHGAGIKPGQDHEKQPPGPDGVLTAAGYRDAQAVGHFLAETLKLSFPHGCHVTVRYALPPLALATGTERKGWHWHWPGQKAQVSLSGEPEATAKVVAQYLAGARIHIEELVPWKAELPGPFLALTDRSRAQIRCAAEGLPPTAQPGKRRLVLVVANSPQIDWVAEELLAKPVAIGRGEVIGISQRHRRRRWSVRKRRDLLWTIGPTEESAIIDLREKIRSKMDTAKFLGAFITALVTFVLGKRFDAHADTALNAGLLNVQPMLWLITIVTLGLAALLCFAAVAYYDGLLMPVRFWESSARPSRLRLRGSSTASWLVRRPPSSAAWVLKQNMVRVWNRLVVAALLMLGVALSAFSVLIVVKPRNYGDLGWPVAIIILAGVLASGYLVLARPHIGTQD